jgi:hypothetical protein
MSARTRHLCWAAAAGVPLSQLGHGVAYLAHYGSHGVLLQEEGVHTYFPEIFRFSGGVVALALLAGLMAVGLGRLLLGRGLGLQAVGGERPVELLIACAAVQLDTYLAQEVLEALAGHQALTFDLLLSIMAWGLAGQLPVAAAAAVALSWLSIRLEAAARGLRSLWQHCVTCTTLTPAAAIAVRPALPESVRPPAHVAAGALSERGPPQLLGAI